MLRLVFMGSPDFALPSLRAVIAHHEVALVMTQPDKPAGRGNRLTAPPVKRVAEEAGVPVIQPRSARSPEIADALRATGADLGVVVAYGKILPRAVLDAFPRGCVNVHASLLPAYRGAAPIQWSIIRGERETGITIMRLDEGMDTGPMLLSRREAVREDDTAGALATRLAELGADALIDALGQLESGTAVETPQDPALATYAPMLTKAHGLVDWSLAAGLVRDLVRGADPWPGAATTLGGVPLKLYGASAPAEQGVNGRATDGSPGQVLAIDGSGVLVACGAGTVRIAELQAPGGRRMAAAELARGRGLAVGATLGP
ncbi:MAG TPA: methionyl-tRNA formyltransferase [Kofleriaceae bacterium]|nr:methionyl-tRNA formyltransferase [Kofleriaceae bacterium]